MPADALWTLVMAMNVYLTFFRKYGADQLRGLEWKYFVFCYGIPFIPSFAYFFIRTSSRGRIYGGAVVSQILFLMVTLLTLDSSGVGSRMSGIISV